MRNAIKITLLVVLTASCIRPQSNDTDEHTYAENQKTSPLDSVVEKNRVLENVRIDNSIVDELTSKYTLEAYDIYISYPANYQGLKKKYAVLIVLDAEVNFGAASYIVHRLTKDELIPELLVVGVAYRGETSEDTYYSLRCRDFTPTTDIGYEQVHKNFTAGTGGAENFLQFLSQELFPYLRKNFPVSPDGHGLYGHSFGGLFGAYALMHQPKLFDRYLLLSPSLWWDRKTLSKKLNEYSSADSQQFKLYMGTGAFENEMIADHLEFVKILQDRKKSYISIKSEILDKETHRTVFGRGFTNGLRFLYADAVRLSH